jgi:hypothetical protein
VTDLMSRGIAGGGVRLIPVMNGLVFMAFCLGFFQVLSFAQTNQTDSLTISTFYPAPVGVYNNIKLVPGAQPANGTAANLTGTVYFNNTSRTVFYRDNTTNWVPVGQGKTGLKIESGHNVTPNVCEDSDLQDPPYDTQVCWDGWFKTINFTRNFTSAPKVFVTQERNPSATKCPCCQNMTTAVILSVTKVTNKNFTVQAAGTIGWESTECGGYDGQHAPIDIGWIAMGS